MEQLELKICKKYFNITESDLFGDYTAYFFEKQLETIFKVLYEKISNASLKSLEKDLPVIAECTKLIRHYTKCKACAKQMGEVIFKDTDCGEHTEALVIVNKNIFDDFYNDVMSVSSAKSYLESVVTIDVKSGDSISEKTNLTKNLLTDFIVAVSKDENKKKVLSNLTKTNIKVLNTFENFVNIYFINRLSSIKNDENVFVAFESFINLLKENNNNNYFNSFVFAYEDKLAKADVGINIEVNEKELEGIISLYWVIIHKLIEDDVKGLQYLPEDFDYDIFKTKTTEIDLENFEF